MMTGYNRRKIGVSIKSRFLLNVAKDEEEGLLNVGD